MPSDDLHIHQLANDWSGLVAATAALAVFALVLRLMPKLLPKLDLKLEWKRRPWRREHARAHPIADAEADAQCQALTGSLETGADRLQAMNALQERARLCIEAAEYSLDRLLADCAAVMLTPEAGARMQHRRAALAEAPATVPAAVPETLAA